MNKQNIIMNTPTQNRSSINRQTKHLSACAVIAVSLMMTLSSASAQEATLKKESIEDYNTRMQWFADAQYGMFIHFGL